MFGVDGISGLIGETLGCNIPSCPGRGADFVSGKAMLEAREPNKIIVGTNRYSQKLVGLEDFVV